MARGWHYTKLSISSALLLSFCGICVYFVIVPFFLSFFFCFLLCFLLLSLELKGHMGYYCTTYSSTRRVHLSAYHTLCSL